MSIASRSEGNLPSATRRSSETARAALTTRSISPRSAAVTRALGIASRASRRCASSSQRSSVLSMSPPPTSARPRAAATPCASAAHVRCVLVNSPSRVRCSSWWSFVESSSSAASTWASLNRDDERYFADKGGDTGGAASGPTGAASHEPGGDSRAERRPICRSAGHILLIGRRISRGRTGSRKRICDRIAEEDHTARAAQSLHFVHQCCVVQVQPIHVPPMLQQSLHAIRRVFVHLRRGDRVVVARARRQPLRYQLEPLCHERGA
mmetsp:Transcript_61340/g.168472  ORF Transcript_61340/g.168472 Transcript_61340/m.168472 type:complete len:266 (-) Transcript_61340:423-1220(-)